MTPFTIGCWLLISFFTLSNAQAQWGVQPQPQQAQPGPSIQRQPVVQQFQQVQQPQQQFQQQQQPQQQQFQQVQQVQQQQPQLLLQRDSQSQQQQQPQFQRPKVIKYNVQARGDEQGDAAAVNRQAEARNQELLSRLRSLNSRGSGRPQQPINDVDEEVSDLPQPTRSSKRGRTQKPATSGERSQNQLLTTRRLGNTVPPSLQGLQGLGNPFSQPQSPFAGLVGGGPQQFGSGQFPSFSAPGSGFVPPSGGFGPGPVPGSGQGQSTGLVSALSALGSQLGRSLGLGGLLGQSGLGGISNIGIPQRAPPVAGIPQVPGVPFPGLGQGGQFDIMGIVGGISRRALNGSRLSDVLPPDRIQQFAENVTEILVPEMPDVDLPLYMGRWFEGISSPRASSQRCVVHHYGGLTENGKTATFTALKIYREGNEFGQVQYSIGYAFRGGRQKSMLQMHSSESQDATPYWVYHVGPTGKDAFGHPQYEYAVVSNWIRYPVMVLVRDPDEFKKNYEVDVLRWLEDHGFINDFARTFNLIQPVDYSNCQYSDSTFAAFGK